MRLRCSNCEGTYVTSLVNAERFSSSLCRMCRHESVVADREIPTPRLFGREVEPARWFAGLIPKYNEQGRRK